MDNKLSKTEYDYFIKTLNDPVLWCETYLRDPRDPDQPLRLRSYQSELLKDTKNFQQMVLRYGRRMGKCQQDTDIMTLNTGERITVGELWKRFNSNEELRLMNLEKDITITNSKPIIMSDNGMKETFEVKTRSGRKINITKNHPLLRIDGWQPVADLKPGDQILVPSKINYETTKHIDDKLVKFLAYLLGDGMITSRIELTNKDINIIDEFEESAKYFNINTKHWFDRGCYYSRVIREGNTNNKAIDYLRELELFGTNSHTKFIPNEIFELNKNQQGLFLSRLYACDGWASVSKSNRKAGNCEIGYCSVSEKLIYGVSDLLVRFGIKHFITEKQVKYNNERRKAYQLCIRTKEDINIFINEIGIFSKEKACSNVLKHINMRTNINNGYFNQVPKEAIDIYNIKTPRKYGIRKKYNTCKDKLLKAAKDQHINDLINICESDTYFDEIVSITSNGENQTYAIEVPDTHNYIVGNIITHNTVALCADALWWCIAQPYAEMYREKRDKVKPFKVLVVAPMDSQITMLFDTLISLCMDSPFIQQLEPKIVRSDVSKITFSNGCTITGKTIAISSGNKGVKLRGDSADYVLVDEVDYIPDDVFEKALLPITNTTDHVLLRCCSTPSGRRGRFFNWCTRGLEIGWWTRHYPSWHKDNPSWVSIKQAEERGIPEIESSEFKYRSGMSDQAYMLEYGAEFGEENQGVFKHTLIDKSMSKYIKNFNSHDTDIFDPGFKQTAGNIYIIGVDWNTYKHGGQVVVIEYCKNPTYIEYYDDKLTQDVRIDCTGKFRLFYRKGVRYKKATQRETRKEIIRLLKEYQIDHIYVDYGAGDTNIEELTFYGKEHPGLGISSKLHVVDSGSTITHYDHLLKEEVKKRAKSLMISLAVVNLEEGRFILPKEEDSDHRLIYQMRNYIIKSTTVKGDFTYDGEDHVLDAFILAVYGFNHQYSNLFMPNYKNKLKFIENPMLTYAPRRKQSEISTLDENSGSSKYRDPDAPVTQLPPWARNRGSSRGSKLFGNGFRKLF